MGGWRKSCGSAVTQKKACSTSLTTLPRLKLSDNPLTSLTLKLMISNTSDPSDLSDLSARPRSLVDLSDLSGLSQISQTLRPRDSETSETSELSNLSELLQLSGLCNRPSRSLRPPALSNF
jgi:hypothetical protein